MPQEEEKGKGPALPFRNDGSFLEQFMKMQQAQAGSAPENIATNINNTASDLSHDKTNDAEEKDNQDDLAKTDADGSDDDKTKPSEDNAEAPAAAAAAPKPGPFAKFAKKSSGAVWMRGLVMHSCVRSWAGSGKCIKVAGRLLTE